LSGINRESLFPFFLFSWKDGVEKLHRVFISVKSKEIPGKLRPIFAAVAQLVERVLGKDEVMGPNPISSSVSERCRCDEVADVYTAGGCIGGNDTE
jgi:hypothetical protein